MVGEPGAVPRLDAHRRAREPRRRACQEPHTRHGQPLLRVDEAQVVGARRDEGRDVEPLDVPPVLVVPVVARDDQVHPDRETSLEPCEERARVGECLVEAIRPRPPVMARDVEPDPVMDDEVVLACGVERDVELGAALPFVDADVCVDPTRPAPQVAGGDECRTHPRCLRVGDQVRADVGREHLEVLEHREHGAARAAGERLADARRGEVVDARLDRRGERALGQRRERGDRVDFRSRERIEDDEVEPVPGRIARRGLGLRRRTLDGAPGPIERDAVPEDGGHDGSDEDRKRSEPLRGRAHGGPPIPSRSPTVAAR